MVGEKSVNFNLIEQTVFNRAFHAKVRKCLKKIFLQKTDKRLLMRL